MDESAIRIRALAEAEEGGLGGEAEQLLAAVYVELHRLAEALTAKERRGQTIQATDLVHEAYLRLAGRDAATWRGRTHFFRAAAEAMRRILVEQARRKRALRHGGGRQREALRDSAIAVETDAIDALAVDEVLDRLEAEDPVKASLVKLRYFVGMTIPQAASALGISHATAERYWTYSRARLYQWLIDREAES